MADEKEIRVPDIGDFEDVPVIEVLVAEGDTVEADQPIIVLESDKSTMEVPAPQAGIIGAVRLKVDDKVKQGDVICAFEPGDAGEGEDGKDQSDEGETRKDRPDDDESTQDEPESAADASEGESSADTAAKEVDDAPAATGKTTVTVPDIGDFSDVPVIEVLVAEGDEVEAEQALVVLESDKSTMEVPAPQAGRVAALKLKVGDAVNQGDVICELEGAAEAGAGEKAESTRSPQPEAAPAQAKKSDDTASGSGGKAAAAPEASVATGQGPRMHPAAEPGLPPHASPAVRRFARELGIDLAQVQGSGRKQRILREDVQEYVKGAIKAAPATAGGGGALPVQPEIDFSKFGAIEQRPLPRIRKLSAQNLHRNWVLIPHVTQTDAADITDIEAFRKQASAGNAVKLTLLPFIIKAVGAAVRQFPEFNSSLSADGESLILKQYCNVGFAADTENGLLVPVVRDVWSKGVNQLATDCAELAEKARDGKLKPDEMRGGCFSISSLGGIGGSHFSPIINAPEVAILGVSRAQMQPVWDGEAFQPRLMCPLSLSYDHRVIDGAAAARFIVHLKGLLEDVRRLLL